MRPRMREAYAINTAAKALGVLTLEGMTQARWDALSERERIELRDISGLSRHLLPYEGDRVEVVDIYGQKRRFWVSRSNGWRPIHIELKRIDSHGGIPADKEYKSVRIITNRYERYQR